jgi:hypothetical protein
LFELELAALKWSCEAIFTHVSRVDGTDNCRISRAFRLPAVIDVLFGVSHVVSRHCSVGAKLQ